jgi:tetratricopeptide (TPR) repeat protein
MKLFHSRSLLFYSVLAITPLAKAQTTSTPASPSSQADNVKEAEDAFRSGSAAYLQNDLLSAHIQFAKVVKLAPEVAAGHLSFGTVLLAEGEVAYAVDQLELAHKLAPQNPDTARNLAIAYSQLREYQKSVQIFRLLQGLKSDALQTLTPQASIAYAAASLQPENLSLRKNNWRLLSLTRQTMLLYTIVSEPFSHNRTTVTLHFTFNVPSCSNHRWHRHTFTSGQSF